jgi:hypothetical protein
MLSGLSSAPPSKFIETLQYVQPHELLRPAYRVFRLTRSFINLDASRGRARVCHDERRPEMKPLLPVTRSRHYFTPRVSPNKRAPAMATGNTVAAVRVTYSWLYPVVPYECRESTRKQAVIFSFLILTQAHSWSRFRPTACSAPMRDKRYPGSFEVTSAHLFFPYPAVTPQPPSVCTHVYTQRPSSHSACHGPAFCRCHTTCTCVSRSNTSRTSVCTVFSLHVSTCYVIMFPVHARHIPVFPVSARYVPVFPVSARYVPVFPVSTCYVPVFPVSARYVPVFPVSTCYVPVFPVSTRYVPVFPVSTRYVPVFPVSTRHVPAFIALVRKVAAAADSSTAPPPSCRPWFSTCTPTLHPTTTHPQPPSG